MRGRVDPQESMFSYFSPDSRVPEEHPLRRIKEHADTVLASMNPEFDRIYAEIGRPSIPPERLLKVRFSCRFGVRERDGPDSKPVQRGVSTLFKVGLDSLPARFGAMK